MWSALVTWAGTRIGRAVRRALAAEGYAVAFLACAVASNGDAATVLVEGGTSFLDPTATACGA